MRKKSRQDLEKEKKIREELEYSAFYSSDGLEEIEEEFIKSVESGDKDEEDEAWILL